MSSAHSIKYHSNFIRSLVHVIYLVSYSAVVKKIEHERRDETGHHHQHRHNYSTCIIHTKIASFTGTLSQFSERHRDREKSIIFSCVCSIVGPLVGAEVSIVGPLVGF